MMIRAVTLLALTFVGSFATRSPMSTVGAERTAVAPNAFAPNRSAAPNAFAPNRSAAPNAFAPNRSAAPNAFAPNPPTPLTGAWEVIERSYQRGDSSWVNRNPEVGRYVFTERYYGVQEIRESGPRPDFTDTTTELERLAAFDVFHAHGGPYEVVGDRLVIRIDIAKSPNTMSGEATYEYRLEFAEDRVRVIREVSDETRVTTLRRLE